MKSKFRVRRVTASGPIEVRQRRLTGPKPTPLFGRKDSKRKNARLRIIEFSPDERGELIRVGGKSRKKWLKWASLAALPIPDPRRRGTLRELPVLAAKLKMMSFTQVEGTWPAEFVRIMEILEPCLQETLREYSGASRWRVTKSLWERLARVVLDTALTRGPADLRSRRFWIEELGGKLSVAYKSNESAEKPQDPKSPGQWFYHGANWRLRIGQIARKYRIGGVKLKAVVAASDLLFGLFYFNNARLLQTLKKPIAIGIEDFGMKIFYPALADAFKSMAALDRREAALPEWEKGYLNQFQKHLYHALRRRFNGWRSKEAYFLRLHGGAAVSLDAPQDGGEEEDGLSVLETVDERQSVAGFDGIYGPEEIRELIKAMPRAGRTYRRFVKIQKTVPDWMGYREALSAVYQKLEKETGIKRNTLRKQVHEAKKFLGRGTWKLKKNGRRS